ncbi:MAG: AmmeMemoRadiSam system radical SAM enzyme [Candidatus Sumerlaeota bacterium]|nr:AmmeMemoRadiSam system radical SAM enzyme [Candidatus Sumerlaeota bacterium]
MKRNDFLDTMARLGLGASLAPLVWMALRPEEVLADTTAQPGAPFHGGKSTGSTARGPIEAEYYRKDAKDSVSCLLCPRHEHLSPGEYGYCRTRRNIGGVLKTYASGQPCVLNVDPIEKNPLLHVLPGAQVLSIAHAGCNMRCQYCQNWQFSQESAESTKNIAFDQEDAFAQGRKMQIAGINFTYTEPTTHIEFNKRLAMEAKRRGLRAFLCSNGYIQPGPLGDFLKTLDAVTITLKGMRAPYQQTYLGVEDYRPVLESCRQVKQAGVWLEVATLFAPGLNDSDEEMKEIAEWISKNLGAETPWHIERFVPKYKMQDRPQTPVATLEKARAIGQAAGLRYVAISNLAPHPANHTYCAKCQKPVIKRVGFKVLENSVKDGKCSLCGAPVAGIWK